MTLFSLAGRANHTRKHLLDVGSVLLASSSSPSSVACARYSRPQSVLAVTVVVGGRLRQSAKQLCQSHLRAAVAQPITAASMSTTTVASAAATGDLHLRQPLRRVLSIQSHVVHGYVGNKSATFPLQVGNVHSQTKNTFARNLCAAAIDYEIYVQWYSIM